MRKLLRQIGYLVLRRRREAEIADELEFHRAERQRQLERAGMSAVAAHDAACKAMGNVTLAREDASHVWLRPAIEAIAQDVRYGTRALTKAPVFAVTALLTLALGIGGSTAMFSIVNAVLLRPLPYADAGRLAMIWSADPARNIHESATSVPTFTDWRRQSRRFVDMAFWRPVPSNLATGSGPERVIGAQASANLFTVLGVTPAIGRTFTADEEQRRLPFVVLSHGLWERQFGADPAAIGRSIEVDGRPLQIIGVMPPGFYFPTRNIQHWVPASLMIAWALKPPLAERSWTDRFADHWNVIGRLAPNATVEQAQAEMTAIGQRLTAAYPTTDPDVVGFAVEVVPMLVQLTGRNLQLALWMLLGAVGFVLLIACANVAHLLLARTSARRRELAVRSALGAGRVRLLRQLFIENTVLTIAGGALGSVIAVAAVRVLAASGAPIPRMEEIGVDARVLAFAAATSAIAALIFGTMPAWKASRQDASGVLKEGGSAVFGGPAAARARGLLVIAECALAVALLAGAGLLIRSFVQVRAVNPGFDSERVLLARVNLPIPVSRDWRRQEWDTFAQINERIAAIPDVIHVGGITNLLVVRNPEEAITVEGRRPPGPNAAKGDLVSTEDVTPGFFQAMSVPLLRGRFFTHSEQNAPVAIVNEAFARRFFPGEDPVGKRFQEGGPGVNRTWITIVGLVGDMRQQGLERQVLPQFFFPSSEPTMDIAIRTRGNPGQIAAAVRDAIRTIYSNAAVVHMRAAGELFGELGAQRRFQTWLLALLAAAALALAAVGVYGVTHFMVSQRVHEFGVRLALGATRKDLSRLVLAEGMLLPLIGLALGLAIALTLTRLLTHLLFGITARDPITFIAVAIVLLAVALVACWLPARKAAAVDPMVALRCG